MARRTGAMHVAKVIRRQRLASGEQREYRSYLLRRSYRDGGKVKHENLGNLSHLPLEVIDAIRVVADGGSLIPPQTIANLLSGRRRVDKVRATLTARETEILHMMSHGASNREIATRLGISYTTVRTHVRNLSGKLAAHSQLEVVMKAQQLDLVARPSAIAMAVA